MVVAGGGKFILMRTVGCVTLTPADEGHRFAAEHDAAEIADLIAACAHHPPEAWVVQVLDAPGPPRFVVLEQLKFATATKANE